MLAALTISAALGHSLNDTVTDFYIFTITFEDFVWLFTFLVLARTMFCKFSVYQYCHYKVGYISVQKVVVLG